MNETEGQVGTAATLRRSLLRFGQRSAQPKPVRSLTSGYLIAYIAVCLFLLMASTDGAITTTLGSKIDALFPNAHTVLITIALFGLLITFGGLLLQCWRQQLGLAVTYLGLGIYAMSGTITIFVGYLIVCWQARFIGAFVERSRKFWGWSYVIGGVGGGLLFTVELFWTNDYFVTTESRLSWLMIWISMFAFICFAVGSYALWWYIGSRQRAHRRALAELHDRAELATLAERHRIAREMHDIVAHSLAVVIAQADGGRFAGKRDPNVAFESLETISRVGREALTQMRGLLTILRADGETSDATPTPGVNEVDQLVAEASKSGLDVSLRVLGTPRPMSVSVGLTLYRTVQEGLTNALKYASGATAEVVLDWRRADEVLVSVDNAVGEQVVAPSGPGLGRGLPGVMERAAIHGGTARWGAAESELGGWRLQVTLPA